MIIIIIMLFCFYCVISCIRTMLFWTVTILWLSRSIPRQGSSFRVAFLTSLFAVRTLMSLVRTRTRARLRTRAILRAGLRASLRMWLRTRFTLLGNTVSLLHTLVIWRRDLFSGTCVFPLPTRFLVYFLALILALMLRDLPGILVRFPAFRSEFRVLQFIPPTTTGNILWLWYVTEKCFCQRHIAYHCN